MAHFPNLCFSKLRKEDEKSDRRQTWSKQSVQRNTNYPGFGGGGDYPSQQEMLNLTGSKRNANQSNNGIQIPTVPIVKSSMRKLKDTIFFPSKLGIRDRNMNAHAVLW